jgi:hypothetical protein
VQNFRTKTGLGYCVFNWFCEAVCSGEFSPFLTCFTSEAWFYLNDHTYIHNSRYWSVSEPRQPYEVPLCHNEFGYFAPSAGYTRDIRDHSLFRHNKFRKLHWTNYPPFIENLSDSQRESLSIKQDGSTAHTAIYSMVPLLDIFKDRIASYPLWSALSPHCDDR